MLNEETSTENVQPQTVDIPKSDIEDELNETILLTTDILTPDPVDSILSSSEEIVTTQVEDKSEEEELEEKVDESEGSSEYKQDTQEEKGKLEHTPTKPNRELKLLLELSKEANLDTNIPYKRKSLDPSKHIEHQDHKYASAPPSDAKRSMRSQNPDFVVKHQKFLSKLTSDGESLNSDNEDKTVKEKTQKKKEQFIIGGAIDEKTRKLLKPVMALIQNNKDGFCWRCHREGITLSCETCPRSYHLKCLKHSTINMEHWVCPECVTILNAENTKTRSPALKDMSLEQLCGLLKFALKRMAQCNDSDPFLGPVNEADFPDYKKYIVQPMDLSKLQRNIRDNIYGSTNAFESDAKWVLHNSIIFNSYQSKLTTIAKSILKICKQEMSEIENCPTCYLNANTNKTWFVEVCPKPHILLWAKLKGFPYWPAKAMSTNSQGMVDVRFFGAHDRAWVPFKECFLYSLKDPNPHKQMKNDIIECIKELDAYIDNLKKVYGDFNYAPFRTPYDPENEVHQLQLLLPTYKPAYHTSTPRKFLKIDTLLKRKSIVDKPTPERQTSKTPSELSRDKIHKEMEGYGTDEEMDNDGYTESRIEGRLKTISRQVSGNLSRISSNDSQSSRRNSDQSTKSDASHLSNASEKINTTDLPENIDINLNNDDITAKVPDSSEAVVKNSTEPQTLSITKLKISDKLIKRLSETNNKESEVTNMEVCEKEENASKSRVEITSSGELEKNVVESEVQPSISDINHVILGSPLFEIKAQNEVSQNKTELNEKNVEENNSISSEKFVTCTNVNSNKKHIIVVKKPDKINENLSKPITSSTSNVNTTTINNDNVVDHLPQHSDDLLEEMYSETVDISSLNNDTPKSKVTDDNVPQVRVTNKRKRPDENENSEINPTQPKFIKLVDINVIKNSQNGGIITVKHDKSILKHRLVTPEATSNAQPQSNNSLENPASALPQLVEIKSEPNSEAENENEDMEAKKQYLSALNISEKVKVVKVNQKEPRVKTRLDVLSNRIQKKTSESKNKSPAVSMNTKENKKEHLPRLIKQLPPKQRARKTFPRSVSSPKSIMKSDTLKVTKIINPQPPPKLTPESQMNNNNNNNSSNSSANNNVVILTQPQSGVASLTVLPPNQTIAYTGGIGNPIFTMVQPSAFSNFIVPTTTLNTVPPPPLNPISDRSISSATQNDSLSTFSVNGLIASANAVFTSGAQSHTSSSSIISGLTLTASTSAPIASTALASSGGPSTITILNGQTTLPVAGSRPTAMEMNEDFSYMTGYIPENISKSICDLMHRAPPKLRPRPPGPLNTSYEPGTPSSAGRVTSVINSVAHKLTDYFRGMLIETLTDLGTADNAESLVTSIRLENERLKQKHAEEILEIKKNVNSILRDIQKSIIDERERVIEDTKAACEIETIKRIEEAKSKQWCANCMKEAQFYCCWNTSYCDYPCQLKHWPKHLSKCTQNPSLQGDSSNMAKLVTPLILRKTAAPKNFNPKAVLTKANKELLNKVSPNKGPSATIKSPAVGGVTIVDSVRHRNFDMKTNIPGSAPVSSKMLNFNKIKPVSMITPTTSNSSSGVIALTPQKYIVTQSKPKATMDID